MTPRVQQIYLTALWLETASTHSFFVHEAPDSSCDPTGKQDDQAAEELQDRTKRKEKRVRWTVSSPTDITRYHLGKE